MRAKSSALGVLPAQSASGAMPAERVSENLSSIDLQSASGLRRLMITSSLSWRLSGCFRRALWLRAAFSLQRGTDAALRFAIEHGCTQKSTSCPTASQFQSYARDQDCKGCPAPSSAFGLSTADQLKRRPRQRRFWRADLHVRSGAAGHHPLRASVCHPISSGPSVALVINEKLQFNSAQNA